MFVLGEESIEPHPTPNLEDRYDIIWYRNYVNKEIYENNFTNIQKLPKSISRNSPWLQQ
jgi:hypothetical protein